MVCLSLASVSTRWLRIHITIQIEELLRQLIQTFKAKIIQKRLGRAQKLWPAGDFTSAYTMYPAAFG